MGAGTGRALAVTALGAATPVGWDVATAAASVRAGLSRAAELQGIELLDEESHEPTPIVGHEAAGLTDGFVLYGRWMRLARTAIEDLLNSLPESLTRQPGYWERAVLLLATRTPDETVFLDEPESTVAAVEAMVGLALLEDLQLPIPHGRVRVLALGHAAGAAALRLADQHLGVHCERALIVAVDTQLDPIVLEQLASQHRLKHGDNAAGLIPGEAAAAVLLEANPAGALAYVTGISLSQAETANPETPERVGTAAATLVAALDEAGVSEFHGDLYLDLNGEPWRAHQWGMALVDVQERFKGRVQLPAISVGDVGAAASILALCLACRAFIRGYAAGTVAAILTTGEAGDSTCVVVQPPSDQEAR